MKVSVTIITGIMQLLAVLPVNAGGGGNPNGAIDGLSCIKDTECMSYCCDNDTDYSV